MSNFWVYMSIVYLSLDLNVDNYESVINPSTKPYKTL